MSLSLPIHELHPFFSPTSIYHIQFVFLFITAFFDDVVPHVHDVTGRRASGFETRVNRFVGVSCLDGNRGVDRAIRLEAGLARKSYEFRG
jgi:hypothetical protein